MFCFCWYVWYNSYQTVNYQNVQMQLNTLQINSFRMIGVLYHPLCLDFSRLVKYGLCHGSKHDCIDNLKWKAGQASQCFRIWQGCRPNQYVETCHPGFFKSLMCTFLYVISLQSLQQWVLICFTMTVAIAMCTYVYHFQWSYFRSSFHWMLWIGFHTSTHHKHVRAVEHGNEKCVLPRWPFPATVRPTYRKFSSNKQSFVQYSVMKQFHFTIYIYVTCIYCVLLFNIYNM